MVEPFVYELRQHNVSKVARPNKRPTLTVFLLPEISTLLVQMGVFSIVSHELTSDLTHRKCLNKRARTDAVT